MEEQERFTRWALNVRSNTPRCADPFARKCADTFLAATVMEKEMFSTTMAELMTRFHDWDTDTTTEEELRQAEKEADFREVKLLWDPLEQILQTPTVGMTAEQRGDLLARQKEAQGQYLQALNAYHKKWLGIGV